MKKRAIQRRMLCSLRSSNNYKHSDVYISDFGNIVTITHIFQQQQIQNLYKTQKLLFILPVNYMSNNTLICYIIRMQDNYN